MKILLLLASLTLVACGSSDNDSSDENSSGDTVGAEIAEDFNNAMDKAQNVEALSQESKENLDEALEEANGAIEEE